MNNSHIYAYFCTKFSSCYKFLPFHVPFFSLFFEKHYFWFINDKIKNLSKSLIKLWSTVLNKMKINNNYQYIKCGIHNLVDLMYFYAFPVSFCALAFIFLSKYHQIVLQILLHTVSPIKLVNNKERQSNKINNITISNDFK